MTDRDFLIVSLDRLIGDIAWRVQRARNNVECAITEDEFSQDAAGGIVPKGEDWKGEVEWADIVVFDGGFGLGTYVEELRAEGVPCVGGPD